MRKDSVPFNPAEVPDQELAQALSPLAQAYGLSKHEVLNGVFRGIDLAQRELSDAGLWQRLSLENQRLIIKGSLQSMSKAVQFKMEFNNSILDPNEEDCCITLASLVALVVITGTTAQFPHHPYSIKHARETSGGDN